jgi:hypothetical protein
MTEERQPPIDDAPEIDGAVKTPKSTGKKKRPAKKQGLKNQIDIAIGIQRRKRAEKRPPPEPPSEQDLADDIAKLCEIREPDDARERGNGSDSNEAPRPNGNGHGGAAPPPPNGPEPGPEPRPEPGFRPRLRPLKIIQDKPHLAVDALRDILRDSGTLYDRDGPVRIKMNGVTKELVACRMTTASLIKLAHHFCAPYVVSEGRAHGVQLPAEIAKMYLDFGDWRLPPLNGITSAPLLRKGGAIHVVRGYDPETGFYCSGVPDIAALIPERPTRAEAEEALRRLRHRFRTLAFADATMIEENGVMVVDTTKPPGYDESGFLVQLCCAVERQSLFLAPALIVIGASLSGAGVGKGLTVRCIFQIAYGKQVGAIAQTTTPVELDKQIVAALREATPGLFLDNFNDTLITSSVLASVLTENPSKFRILGLSEMARMTSSAFVGVTGNGLMMSKDLVRRGVRVDLDGRCEDPENRVFNSNLLDDVSKARHEILVEVLTIWRHGQQNQLKPGKALGNYDQWCLWTRDPLLDLGCKDPVERLSEYKKLDPARDKTTEAFDVWWEEFRDRWVTVKEACLKTAVLNAFDPVKQSKHYISRLLKQLTLTRISNYIFECIPGRRVHYRLLKTEAGLKEEAEEKEAERKAKEEKEAKRRAEGKTGFDPEDRGGRKY